MHDEDHSPNRIFDKFVNIPEADREKLASKFNDAMNDAKKVIRLAEEWETYDITTRMHMFAHACAILTIIQFEYCDHSLRDHMDQGVAIQLMQQIGSKLAAAWIVNQWEKDRTPEIDELNKLFNMDIKGPSQ